ncbi:MAG: cell division protein FtsL [Nitrospira sp.]|nr:cell division protein FtsL [Nitrospira sp.]MCP9441305.1 cell division protein FtsL [Nitrospira sp.]
MRILGCIGGLCLVLVFVWERGDIVRVGYQIQRLKAEKVRLERERDHLRVQLSALSAPDRIAKVATERLGMTLPQDGQVIMVKSRPASPSVPSAVPVEIRVARNDVSEGRR